MAAVYLDQQAQEKNQGYTAHTGNNTSMLGQACVAAV
jgi:hypothetical protein